MKIKQIKSLLENHGRKMCIEGNSLRTDDGDYSLEAFFELEKTIQNDWIISRTSRNIKKVIIEFNNEVSACRYFYLMLFQSLTFKKISKILNDRKIILSKIVTVSDFLLLLQIIEIPSIYYSIDGTLKYDAFNIAFDLEGFQISYLNKQGEVKSQWKGNSLISVFYSIYFLYSFREEENRLLDMKIIMKPFSEDELLNFIK